VNITFDTSTGDFFFTTTNEVLFPVGEYQFKVTIHIYSASEEVMFTMFVHNCPSDPLVILAVPPSLTTYTLAAPAETVFLWNINYVADVTEEQKCGHPVMQFMYEDERALDTDLFTLNTQFDIQFI